MSSVVLLNTSSPVGRWEVKTSLMALWLMMVDLECNCNNSNLFPELMTQRQALGHFELTHYRAGFICYSWNFKVGYEKPQNALTVYGNVSGVKIFCWTFIWLLAFLKQILTFEYLILKIHTSFIKVFPIKLCNKKGWEKP